MTLGCFLTTFDSETTSLETHLESILGQIDELDTIKDKQSEMVAKHSSLLSNTKQKLKTLATLMQ